MTSEVITVLIISVLALWAGLDAHFPALVGIGILALLDVTAHGSTRRPVAGADVGQQAAQVRVVALLALIIYLLFDGLLGLGGAQEFDGSTVGTTGMTAALVLSTMCAWRSPAREDGRTMHQRFPGWRLRRLAWLSGVTAAAYAGQSLFATDWLGAIPTVVIAGAAALEVRSAWREVTNPTATPNGPA